MSDTAAATRYWASRHETATPGWTELYRDDLQAPHRQEMLKALSRVAGKAESLLEIGCNAGPNLRLIARKYPALSLYGIDVNKAAIREAAAIAQTDGWGDRAYFICRDFTDGLWLTADVVLSCYALAYVAPDMLPQVMWDIGQNAHRAVIFLEPMGDAGRQVHRHPPPEWGHNYLDAAQQHLGRPFAFTGWPIQAVDRLNGALVLEFL